MQMIIGGELVESQTLERFPVINPSNRDTVDAVPKGTREDAKRAIDCAYEAFIKWSSTSPAQRAKLLFKLAQEVRNDQTELARMLTMEQGKPLVESEGEILRFQDLCEFYGGLATKLRGVTQNIANQSVHCDVIKEPVGVVGIIIPWNFPVSLFGFKLAPALAAGNTVVVKPASTTPLTDLKICELVKRTGIPDGVVNIVTGPGAIMGQELLENSKVRKIAFTGETDTGKHIMQSCANSVKRITLELGGSDPMIVCSDADLALATEAAIWGRFRNCGQVCTAVKRLFIFDDIYEGFMRKLVEAVKRIKIGDGLDPKTLMGPLNNAPQRKMIEDQVEDARKRGAKVLVGGRRPVGPEFDKGLFYLPTVLADVDQASRVAIEECFGPVLPVFPVSNLDEAMKLANSTSFGLGASIWTSNLTTARVAAEKFEAGTVWINSPPILRIEVPFGGVKESGLGRELGTEALDAYMETKTLQTDISGPNKTWRFFPT